MQNCIDGETILNPLQQQIDISKFYPKHGDRSDKKKHGDRR
jgi:hypothetical protein